MTARPLHRALATAALPIAVASALLALTGQQLHCRFQPALDEVTP